MKNKFYDPGTPPKNGFIKKLRYHFLKFYHLITCQYTKEYLFAIEPFDENGKVLLVDKSESAYSRKDPRTKDEIYIDCLNQAYIRFANNIKENKLKVKNEK